MVLRHYNIFYAFVIPVGDTGRDRVLMLQNISVWLYGCFRAEHVFCSLICTDKPTYYICCKQKNRATGLH